MRSIPVRLCFLIFCVLALAGVSVLWGDPPNRVGRLNFLSGTVSFHPDSVDDWASATLNYPLTIGDNLWTDQDGQAEAHIGSTAIRLGPTTEISFLNLSDQAVQIRLSTGSLNLRLRHLDPADQVEVDTPNASFSLLQPGSYRIDVQQNGDSAASVRSGQMEVNAGDSVVPVRLGEAIAIRGLDSPAVQVTGAPPLNDWDRWCQERDQKEDQVASARYVPRDEMSGVEDLDRYGSWSTDPDYGPVWAPTVIVTGWAPYSFGHWVWVDPWGWTWIDDAPWGFAPFHYGRWAFRSKAWRWVPGANVSRAVYAPALVTFVGGGDWHSSQAPGGSVGWFPLGPREPFIASYRARPTLMHNVDVAHMVYVNRTVPGAVTFVSSDAFVHGQRTGGVALRLPNDELARAPVRGAVAPIAPQRESFLGGSSSSQGRIGKPPASVLSRPVVVRVAPPPRSVPFAARQQALAARPGQPLDAATLTKLRGSSPVVRSPVIVSPARQLQQAPAQQARPVVQPGRQPQQAPAQQARPVVQPGRQPQQAPAQQARPVVQPARQPQQAVKPPTGTAAQPSPRQPQQAPTQQARPVVQPARQPQQAVKPPTGTAAQPSRQQEPRTVPADSRSKSPCPNPPCS